jgi:hypothetical protein
MLALLLRVLLLLDSSDAVRFPSALFEGMTPPGPFRFVASHLPAKVLATPPQLEMGD